MKRLGCVPITHGPLSATCTKGYRKIPKPGSAHPGPRATALSGFVTDGLGGVSGQIDCMLVHRAGGADTLHGRLFWHVKDVLAVLEIKKTLYARDLADAFDHLGAVRTLEANYIESGQAEREFDDTLAMRALASNDRLSRRPAKMLTTRTARSVNLPTSCFWSN